MAARATASASEGAWRRHTGGGRQQVFEQVAAGQITVEANAEQVVVP